MDKVEMFGNFAHNSVSGVERRLSFMQRIPEDHIGYLAKHSAATLEYFETFVKEDFASSYLFGALNSFIEIGMCGNLLVKGGTPDANKLANEMTDLYARKNRDYGNSFDKTMDKFGLVVSAIRIGDKVSRLQSLVANKGEAQVKDESIADTFIDLACYAIMTGLWLYGLEQEKEEQDE